MKLRLNLSLALAMAFVPVVTGCQAGKTAAANSTVTEQVQRGRYLVNAIGCNDCHTPLKVTERGPEPDMTRMLSGHPSEMKMTRPPKLGDGPWAWAGAATNTAFAGPWGITFAANLTPDQNSGLGIWTEDMFVRALRTGRHMGTSRQIMPPMPWPAFKNLTDEDLKSIYAYLRSIPPVSNHVPDYLEPPEVEARLQ
jgi:mono/diheme cytochrome c family protein